MITILSFTGTGGAHAATFTSSGAQTLLVLKRTEEGLYQIKAGPDASHQNIIVHAWAPADVTRNILLPAGTVVTVESQPDVAYGAIIAGEAAAAGPSVTIDGQGNITVE